MSDDNMDEKLPISLQAAMNYQTLPKNVKSRVHALKNLQLEGIKLEENFFRKMQNLEMELASEYQAIFKKRNEIVTGVREPTKEESKFESDCEDDLDDDIMKEMKEKYIKENKRNLKTDKGIPDFWLMVLQHSDISSKIQEQDMNVLKHLVDIKCVLKDGDENGFTLEFYFSPNIYFTNEKLTKQYFIQINAFNNYPLGYAGPETIRTEGCKIDWCKGKNTTEKQVKKVLKAKKITDRKIITTTEKRESIFNFFNPPTSSIESDDLNSDDEDVLHEDFELGEYLKESVIPRAVMFYTGEKLEDEDDGSCDEDDCDDDDCNDEHCHN